MPIAPFKRFDCFVEDICEKKHDLSADALKIMLTNTSPSTANTVKSNITEITAKNGYTAGGGAATLANDL
jgi:hypothetical protein